MPILYQGNKSWSGAGVLVVEDYKHPITGVTIPCIVVARSKYSHKYGDFGGAYEYMHGRLSVTAHMELREESRNLFYVPPDVLRKNYFDIDAGTHLNRIYVIKINGSSSAMFHHNKRILDSNFSTPGSWKETDDFAHIPLINLTSTVLNSFGDAWVVDVHGRRMVLEGRTKKAVRIGLQTGNINKAVSNDRYTTASKHLIIHKSPRFTNGTFIIKKEKKSINYVIIPNI